MNGPKWESVYLEKVACCGRVVRAGFEMEGEEKEPGPIYGNTTFERHFEGGDHTKGRWLCENCPSKRVMASMTIFPATCDRPEATE